MPNSVREFTRSLPTPLAVPPGISLVSNASMQGVLSVLLLRRKPLRNSFIKLSHLLQTPQSFRNLLAHSTIWCASIVLKRRYCCSPSVVLRPSRLGQSALSLSGTMQKGYWMVRIIVCRQLLTLAKHRSTSQELMHLGQIISPSLPVYHLPLPLLCLLIAVI